MLLCNVPVLVVPGLLRCPVQQRKIQQAVDNQAVIPGLVHRAPRLNKFSLCMVSGNQLVGCLDCRLPAFLTSDQLVCRHTGGRVQEAHVVMIHGDLFVNSLKEIVNLNLSRLLQSLIPAELVRQPDLARPEASRPIPVLHRRVEAVLAVRLLEFVRKFRQHMKVLPARKIQCAPDLLRRNLRVSLEFLFHKAFLPFLHSFSVSFSLYYAILSTNKQTALRGEYTWKCGFGTQRRTFWRAAQSCCLFHLSPRRATGRHTTSFPQSLRSGCRKL